MSSTLGCIGLDVESLEELEPLLDRIGSTELSTTGSVATVAFADPSGSTVVIDLDKKGALSMIPTFRAPLGARLSQLVTGAGVSQADVTDDGETLTRMACDLLQQRHLPVDPDREWDAAVVTLGIEMEVHADAAAFEASDASRLGGAPDGPQFAIGSFMPVGMFGDDDMEPLGHLTGEVTASATHTHAATGQRFHTAEITSVGFDTTVCLAASDHPTAPPVGSVLAGHGYLVVDVPELWARRAGRPRRRLLRRA